MHGHYSDSILLTYRQVNQSEIDFFPDIIGTQFIIDIENANNNRPNTQKDKNHWNDEKFVVHMI